MTDLGTAEPEELRRARLLRDAATAAKTLEVTAKELAAAAVTLASNVKLLSDEFAAAAEREAG